MGKRTPRTAADIMSTEVVSVEEDQSIATAAELLSMLRFRHMPVTEGNRLLGLVTERDVLRVSASSAAPNASAQGDLFVRTVRVKDVMTRDVKTAEPSTPLWTVAQRMQDDKLGCMPVVDSGGTLVGIITEADFVALAAVLLAHS